MKQRYNVLSNTEISIIMGCCFILGFSIGAWLL